MKRREKTRSRQVGVGLMEVLIVLLVLSAGILAHIRFQKLAYREVGLASSRMLAAELAAEKIDDLRSFSTLYTAASLRAYQDIGTDTGGSIAPGVVTAGNLSLTRRWTVTNWYYPVAGDVPSTTVPAGNPLPDMKQVTVTMSWVDLNNEVQTFVLGGIVAAADPRAAAGMFQ